MNFNDHYESLFYILIVLVGLIDFTITMNFSIKQNNLKLNQL